MTVCRSLQTAIRGEMSCRERLSDRGITIGRVMMIIALAAANLALLREVPWETHKYPTIWVFLGIVDYVVLRKLILRRTLRAADYAFLIVLVVAFIPLVYLTAEERIHPVGPLIRAYQLAAGDAGAGVVGLGIAFVCDIWMAAAMAILIAWAAASRRHGWNGDGATTSRPSHGARSRGTGSRS